MEYKITGFNPYAGSAQVNFFTAEFPEGLTYNVDVPVENGSYISGDALRSHIMAFAPYGQIARIVELRDNPPDTSGIPTGDIIVPPEPLDPVLDATLPEAITYAEAAIDREAGKARGRFVSSGTGQDGTYITKASQAQAFADAGYTGDVPPYIAAEAASTGSTATATANLILATRDVWNNTVGPDIEAARVGGKKKVRKATTVQAVDSELRAATLALQAIHP
jgi:hypothetical protein